MKQNTRKWGNEGQGQRKHHTAESDAQGLHTPESAGKKPELVCLKKQKVPCTYKQEIVNGFETESSRLWLEKYEI